MIREANINDVDAIVEIIYEAWQQAFDGILDPGIPKSLNREKYTNIFIDIISNKLEKTFVFESAGKVCGYISGKAQNGLYDSEVLGLYVHPDNQGKQIGSQLLKNLKVYFQNKKCSDMIIWTLLNAKNNQFYKKQGGEEKYYKPIEIRSEQYPGVGFYFKLLPVE